MLRVLVLPIISIFFSMGVYIFASTRSTHSQIVEGRINRHVYARARPIIDTICAREECGTVGIIYAMPFNIALPRGANTGAITRRKSERLYKKDD